MREDGPARLFQMGAVGLVVAAAAASWCLRPARARIVAALAGTLLLALLHLLAGGRDALGLLALVASAVAAAAGIAALGRRLGLPWAGAGALALTMLVGAWTGLLWADAVAARAPSAERSTVRRAVLSVDALTALAYGPADHDRLHEPDIYARVPLASSVVGMPAVGRVALGHALVALVAVLLAAGPPRRRT